MKVTVTQDHINRGQPNKCELCPIALALKDVGIKWPVVSNAAVHDIMLLSKRPLPQNVIEFIDDFDHGRAVKPFTFHLQKRP